jgi:hypothetical protein
MKNIREEIEHELTIYGGEENYTNEQATNKILSLIKQVVEECLPEKSDRSGEQFDKERQSRVNTWDYGFNKAVDEMKAKLKEMLG